MSTETQTPDGRNHEWYNYRVEVTVEHPARENSAGNTTLSEMMSETFKDAERAANFAEHLQELGMSAQIVAEPYESYGAIDFDQFRETHS